jgi:coatomer protein complex subunit epsilon
MSNPASDLFELRNYYLLGNYQGAINEGNSLPVSTLKEQDKVERDVYIYRSYIAQGKYNLVLSEISDSAPAPLQAVKLLANYLQREENRESVVSHLKEWLKDGNVASNPFVQQIAATIYYNHQSYEDAMRCVYQSTSLEGYLDLQSEMKAWLTHFFQFGFVSPNLSSNQ